MRFKKAAALLLLGIYGCQPALGPAELEQPTGPLITKSARINNGIHPPWSYNETTGLPPSPKAAMMRLSELKARIGSKHPEVIAALEKAHKKTDTYDPKVRYLEANSREYSIFLSGNQVLLPQADGVFAQQPPGITHASLNAAAECASSANFQCDPLYETDSLGAPLTEQPVDVVLLLGWNVELAGDVATQGRSLFIVSESFKSNGHEIDTRATFYRERPESVDTKATSGRHGENGGSVIVFANVLDKLRTLTDGAPGENGTNGRDVDANPATPTVHITYEPAAKATCTGTIYTDSQDGGDGGNGGHAGDVLVRYTTLVGSGPSRAPVSTTPITEWQCFSDPALGCANPLCANNPSIAICDVLTEADNAQCRDGIDNDADGKVDCEDPNCAANPYVSVCAHKVTSTPQFREFSVEACTDDVDNDGDGYKDCADFSCRSHGFCKGEGNPESCKDGLDNDRNSAADCNDDQCKSLSICGGPSNALYIRTSGGEEASTAACSNGLDDDLDGKVDCADYECRNNPTIKVCTTENSLEACTDGIDNDRDGFADCNDYDCSRNPYVKICTPQYYPFLKESTVATCSDRLDNDSDGFVDCKDFQCNNNQLASSVCGDFENTLAECTDGIDNNGNGAKDCGEDTCRYNPFFGEFICEGKSQTPHDQMVTLPTAWNGVNPAAAITASSKLGAAGVYGFKGKSYSYSNYVPKCPPTSDPACMNTKVFVSCHLGHLSQDGVSGQPGTAGDINVRWIERRQTDTLRSLLSPNQWITDLSAANHYFKMGQQQIATFHYLHTLVRLQSMQVRNDINCEPLPEVTALDPLTLSICPTLGLVQLRLSYLRSGLDFWGQSREAQINTNEHYSNLYQQFMAHYDTMDSAVGRYLMLSNSIDLMNDLKSNANVLENESKEIGTDLKEAAMKQEIARQVMVDLATALSDRKKIIDAIEEDLVLTQPKEDPPNLGDFIVGLGLGVAQSFTGQFLGQLGGRVADAIGRDLKGLLQKEEGKPVTEPPADNQTPQQTSSNFWDMVAGSAQAAIGSAPVKKAVSDQGQVLWDLLSRGRDTSPAPPLVVPRSIVAEDVRRLLAQETQQRLTLEYTDLVAEYEKAKMDYEVAKLETRALRVQSMAANELARRAKAASTSAELSMLDRILLARQAFTSATTRVDILTRLYWTMVRQAEYEFLPFSPTTGASGLPADILKPNNFTLLNYEELKDRALTLDSTIPRASGTVRPYYRRVVGNPFVPASDTDIAQLSALGFPIGNGSSAAHIYRFRLDHMDVRNDSFLGVLRNHRINNVHVNLVGPTMPVPGLIYVARTPIDAFTVGYDACSADVSWVADFELQELERYFDGENPVKKQLHFENLVPCTSPTPTCDFSDPNCSTGFQSKVPTRACSIAGQGHDPSDILLYKRSLLGDWFLIIPDSVYGTATTPGIGQSIQGVELTFEVFSQDRVIDPGGCQAN
ncbi:hypothetical protein JQX13_04510 [Archangium violaceum]|uniref:hypothetical protein n=1 Tax=Archangium violaceum TaxID=83451 RepID=UPI00193C6AE6|nr:hypothetical protein [Archangium violaceum]QRK09412.1 hypothetical protein JQX13_04510 [Archangium violaceum]